jgi:hypothetical protein
VSSPGAYAEERYRRGLASWRRRAFRPLLVACAPIIVVTLALAVATGSAPFWFGAGLALGGAAATLALVRDDPPGDVASWGLGAAGERRTGVVLRVVEAEGWQVLHDEPLGRGGNLDHLVLGPNGVFLLETKTIRGSATVDDGVLMVRSRDAGNVFRHRGLRERLIARSAALADEIARSSRIRPWVRPVVVVWGAFPQGAVESGGVVYVRGDELVAWLRGRPPVPHEVEFVA